MADATYTSRQGDTWDAISLRVYGSERYMDQLIVANGEHAYTAIFSAGVVLTVPTLDATTPTTLPPWRLP